MGVMNFLDSVKNWTVDNVLRKKPDEDPDEVPNLGEDIRLMVHTREFGRTLDSASPFLLASLGAWPGYWVYRGLDYHSHRAHVPLPIYIRQTFFQAKMLQFAIIIAGIFTIIKEQHRTRMVRMSPDHDED